MLSNFTFGACHTRSQSEAVEEIQPAGGSQESLTVALGGVSLADEGRQPSLTFSPSSKISSKSSQSWKKSGKI